MNRIVAAALMFNGLCISMPKPARHGTIMNRLPNGVPPIDDDHQGFLTDTGEFVDRYLAFDIAKDADQIIVKPGRLAPIDRLYSEDVW